MRYDEQNFLIRKEKFPLLLDCLRKLYSSDAPNLTKQEKRVGLLELEDGGVYGALYGALKIRPIFKGRMDSTDICGMNFMKSQEHHHSTLLPAIAPAVESGASLTIPYKNGDILRYSFDNGTCICEKVCLVCPSDLRYVVYSMKTNPADIIIHGSFMDYSEADKAYNKASFMHTANKVDSTCRERKICEKVEGKRKISIITVAKHPDLGEIKIVLQPVTGKKDFSKIHCF